MATFGYGYDPNGNLKSYQYSPWGDGVSGHY
jgi:hypothetical protein